MTAREPINVAVITVSDRCARGERTDASGPAAVDALVTGSFRVVSTQVVPDGEGSVAGAIHAALEAGARLVVTSGGTGVGPRDRTPEGTRRLLATELPGIAEELRRRGASGNPLAVLSRGLVGVVAGPPPALVVNLPGSVAGVVQGLEVVVPLVSHVLDQLDGGDHHAKEGEA